MPSPETASEVPFGGSAAVRPELEERLRDVVDDRAATAEEIVIATARALHGWVLEQDEGWTWASAGARLERGLEAWRESHAWRGTAALFVDTLRATCRSGVEAWGAGDQAATPRAVLGEELGLWLWGREDGCEELVSPDGPWDGRPLASGLRMPRRQELARHLISLAESCDLLGPGETIVVPAFSETVALVLEAARRAGLAPEAVVSEGAPGLDGRRMARRLAGAGVKVRYVYDSALVSFLPRADRVWLGTEALGGEGFLGRVGTRTLLEEAGRRDVPSLLLATSDKLVPGGALELPRWCERDTWLLWEEAPSGVRLEPQAFEVVPHVPGGILTEVGHESAAALSLRALRVETQPPCPGAEGVHSVPIPFELRDSDDEA